jgi:hypothetical protein
MTYRRDYKNQVVRVLVQFYSFHDVVYNMKITNRSVDASSIYKLLVSIGGIDE